jgi:hypothetical protein
LRAAGEQEAGWSSSSRVQDGNAVLHYLFQVLRCLLGDLGDLGDLERDLSLRRRWRLRFLPVLAPRSRLRSRRPRPSLLWDLRGLELRLRGLLSLSLSLSL